MKKIMVFIIFIFTYGLLIYFTHSDLSFHLNQQDNFIRMDMEGNIFTIQSDKDETNIIKIGLNDSISTICSIDNMEGDYSKEVVDMVVKENDIYVLIKFVANQGNTINKWQIFNYSLENFKSQILFEIEETVDIKRISMEKDKLYLSGKSESNTMVIYEADILAEAIKPKIIMEKTIEEVISDVVVCSEGTYILTISGTVWKFYNEELSKINSENQEIFTCIEPCDNSLIMFLQNGFTISYATTNEVLFTVNEEMSVKSIASINKSQIQFLALDNNKTIHLFKLEDGKLFDRTEDINQAGKKLNISLKSLILVSVFYFVLLFLLFFLIWSYRKSKRLSVKISMICMVMISILIAIFTYAAYRNNTETLEKERVRLCKLENKSQVKNLESLNLDNISQYEFYQTPEYQKIDMSFFENGDRIQFQHYLIYFDNKPYVIGSGNDEIVIGTVTNSVFPMEIYSFIIQSIKNNNSFSKALTVSNNKCAITVSPVGNSVSSNLFFMTTASMTDLTKKKEDSLRSLVLIALAILFITILLLVISIRIALYPIKKISKAMSLVAEGDYEVHVNTIPNHEIGEMWISLKKMCNALQNKSIQNDKILQSYYRFVPKKLENLLDKSNIMDVKVGDVKHINATFGLISVSDKIEVYKNINNVDYMQYINKCFKTVYSISEENQGILLSNDFNISSIKVVFPDSKDKAVNSGINIITSLLKTEKTPVVLIHTTSYLYGIAGTKTRAFPFVNSLEMEVLSRFIPDFRKYGVKMIVTQNTVKNLRNSYTMRYIGYVRGEAENLTFKLYEILDINFEHESNARMKLDFKFQEGIQMFYRNDFYMAQSCFLEVIKEFPNDGIAKWYLFTCEEMLNISNYKNIQYDLFSRRE